MPARKAVLPKVLSGRPVAALPAFMAVSVFILAGAPPHFGIDIAAPRGAEVVAPASGAVTLAESDMYFEGGLFIDHGLSVISTV